MELRPYLRAVRRWWWLLILATVLAGGTGYWNSSQQVRIFQTAATVRVGQFAESSDPRISDYATSQQLAQVYAQSVKRQAVLQATADTLGLQVRWQALAGQVQAFVPAQTSIIQIGVVDSDPERAKAVADEVARQVVLQSPTADDQEQDEHRRFVAQQLLSLRSRIEDAEQQVEGLQDQILEETSAVRIKSSQDRIAALQQQVAGWESTYARLLDFYKGSRTNSLTVVDSAVVPTRPISPNTQRDVLIAASVGLLLAAAASVLIELVDRTVHDPEDVARELGLPVLASVARIHQIRRQSTAVALNGAALPVLESFRILRTNLQSILSSLPNDRMVLVTSPGPREGKSLTSANLALSFARAGRRTILVDLDMHRPTLHTTFGLPNTRGLGTLFLGEQPVVQPEQTEDALPFVRAWWPEDTEFAKLVESLLVKTANPNLMVLTSGPAVEHHADILASPLMDRVLATLSRLADEVVLDSPPLLPVADAPILATKAVNVILVIEAGRTRVREARAAQEMLAGAQATVVGVVLNKAAKSSAGYYSHYTAREAAVQLPAEGNPQQMIEAIRLRMAGNAPESRIGEPTPAADAREGNPSP